MLSWFPCEAWLAQSVEHETLNLRVVGSSPTSGKYTIFLSFSFFFPPNYVILFSLLE